jgi:PiT family inorganic phosphate transporter
VIAAVAGTAAVLFMFFYSRKSHVSHHNAVEVEEAGQAVRFARKKALARARAKPKAKATKAVKATPEAPAPAPATPEVPATAAPPANTEANQQKDTQR